MSENDNLQKVKALIENSIITQEQFDQAVKKQAELKDQGQEVSVEKILLQGGFITQKVYDKIAKSFNKNSIPGFVLEKKLGQGAIGAVFLATQEKIGRKVAIKVMHEKFFNDEMKHKRFAREAKMLCKVRHQNLVCGYDLGKTDKFYYIVMEYAEGESLIDILEREGKLSEEKVFDIITQAAQGLAHAHEQGLVHRDIKPDNLMMTPDGTIKITDFGLARASESVSITVTGKGLGSPTYISPEQAQDAKDVDIRADIYSLGITAYRLVTGKPPYDGNPMEIIMDHINKPFPNPNKEIPELSDGFCRMIMKMCRKKREERYQTPNDILEDIEKIKAGHKISVFQDEKISYTSTSENNAEEQKSKTPLIAGLAGALVVLAIAIFMMIPGDPEINNDQIADQYQNTPTPLNDDNNASETPTPENDNIINTPKETPKITPINTPDPTPLKTIKTPTVEAVKEKTFEELFQEIAAARDTLNHYDLMLKLYNSTNSNDDLTISEKYSRIDKLYTESFQQGYDVDLGSTKYRLYDSMGFWLKDARVQVNKIAQEAFEDIENDIKKNAKSNEYGKAIYICNNFLKKHGGTKAATEALKLKQKLHSEAMNKYYDALKQAGGLQQPITTDDTKDTINEKYSKLRQAIKIFGSWDYKPITEMAISDSNDINKHIEEANAKLETLMLKSYEKSYIEFCGSLTIPLLNMQYSEAINLVEKHIKIQKGEIFRKRLNSDLEYIIDLKNMWDNLDSSTFVGLTVAHKTFGNCKIKSYDKENNSFIITTAIVGDQKCRWNSLTTQERFVILNKITSKNKLSEEAGVWLYFFDGHLQESLNRINLLDNQEAKDSLMEKIYWYSQSDNTIFNKVVTRFSNPDFANKFITIKNTFQSKPNDIQVNDIIDLNKMLEDISEASIKKLIAENMETWKSNLIPKLINDLESDDSKIIIESLKTLTYLKANSAQSNIIRILKTASDKDVFNAALTAIKKIGDSNVTAPLFREILMNNQDKSIKQLASQALIDMLDYESIDTILDALTSFGIKPSLASLNKENFKFYMQFLESANKKHEDISGKTGVYRNLYFFREAFLLKLGEIKNISNDQAEINEVIDMTYKTYELDVKYEQGGKTRIKAKCIKIFQDIAKAPEEYKREEVEKWRKWYQDYKNKN